MNSQKCLKSKIQKMKKFFEVRIIYDRKKHILRINYFYYLNEIFDELNMNANKHNRIKLSMNDYDTFRSIDSNNKRVDLKK